MQYFFLGFTLGSVSVPGMVGTPWAPQRRREEADRVGKAASAGLEEESLKDRHWVIAWKPSLGRKALDDVVDPGRPKKKPHKIWDFNFVSPT